MIQSTQRIIRDKIGLLKPAEELGNASKACQMRTSREGREAWEAKVGSSN